MEQGKKTAKIVLDVSGMHCDSCAKVIESDLADVPGVVEVAVDYDSARATITVDEGVAPDALIKVVTDAGYKAEVSDGNAGSPKKKFGWW